jgi:hypothetical protein
MTPRLLSRCLVLAFSVSLLSSVGLAPSAFAQGKKAAAKKAPEKPAPAAEGAKPGDAGEAPAEQSKVKVERGAGGRKVYKIEGAIVIEGKIQKPEAFYVLQKSNINYDWHELKQEFVPKILDSVTKAPF